MSSCVLVLYFFDLKQHSNKGQIISCDKKFNQNNKKTRRVAFNYDISSILVMFRLVSIL